MKTLPLFSAYHDGEIDEVSARILKSGQIASGPFVQTFTDAFAELVGQEPGCLVTTDNMSSAIMMALHLSGVKGGDEVLTTSFACLSTNSPIANMGARPVWVDIDSKTGLMSVEALEKAITPNCKAVILYHLSGYPANVEKISAICQKHGLKLIEDCDNALLAEYRRKKIGTFGDFAIYSFYPNRQINAIEGGALACKDKNDAERAVKLKRFGINLSNFRLQNGEINPESDVPEMGWSISLNNLNSAIAQSQLATVTSRVDHSRYLASLYREKISEISGIECVECADGAISSYWTFLIRVENRDTILDYLKSAGVMVSKLHCPNHYYSGFHSELIHLDGTERFFEKVLALPCGWWMDTKDIDRVVCALKDAILSLT